ncbi:MAG: hypothetical protein WCP12_08050 [bacterium]
MHKNQNGKSSLSGMAGLVLLIIVVSAYSAFDKSRKREETRIEKERQEEVERLRIKELEEQERKRIAAIRETDAKEAEVKIKTTNVRQNMLREFALEHAPELWKTAQDIKALIEDSNARMDQLKKNLETLGNKPDDDEDYQKMGTKRNELSMVLMKLEEELEAAFLQYSKFQAAPDGKSVSNSVTRALSEGKQSAVEARERYEALKKELMP